MVQADLNDVESLKKAFAGAYGVFGLTNFWECFYDAEIKQGKILADAAKATGIKYALTVLSFCSVVDVFSNRHFVWSTLDHSNVPHFESKALVGDYLDKIGKAIFFIRVCVCISWCSLHCFAGVPTTHLYTAFYFENLFKFMPPKKEGSDIVWYISVPAEVEIFS